MPQTIPTFAADGRRLRAYSVAAIERLVALSLVVVKRNRRNRVVCAHFRQMDGATPLRGSLGQRYSFLEWVGAARIWQHKRLPPASAFFGESVIVKGSA